MDDKLQYFRGHPHYQRFFDLLGRKDLDIIYTFIQENDSRRRDDFEMKLNRLFLDQRENRPKNWKHIMEILSVYNGIRVK